MQYSNTNTLPSLVKNDIKNLSKFGLQDFFNNQDDDAKMKANIQFDFLFEAYHANDPASTWQKLMNVVLEDKTHKRMLDMVNFNNNEFEIINRNMPFIFKNKNTPIYQRNNSNSKILTGGKSNYNTKNQRIRMANNYYS